ncbi:MAG: biotin/lipoyl-binding protein, partial [Oscillospiraceae bacterium]|nr:biotin/lipoyl-binding protein [Oscillospiraceae bacterium]
SVYDIVEGTKVARINVSEGDSVQKGDVLATFDTSGMIPAISERQQAYNDAIGMYNSAQKSTLDSKSKISQLDKEIAELQAQADKLRAKETNSPPPTAGNNAGTPPSSGTQSGSSVNLLKMLMDALAALNNPNGGNQTGITMPTTASNGIGNLIDQSGSQAELISIEAQMAMLKAQKSVLEASGGVSSLSSVYKMVAGATKKSLDEIKSQKAEMDRGWIAKADGIVSKINIREGEVYTQSSSYGGQVNISGLLDGLTGDTDIASLVSQVMSSGQGYSSAGMIVESFSDYSAKFTLGKYDSQRIKYNMPATVSFLSYEYSGVVSFISAKAQSGSGSLSALSGSSSSNTLDAIVSIDDPDTNLILGFDAKVSILIGEVQNALLIPIESLQGDTEEKFVFIYNKAKNRAEKRLVEVGISSDRNYEIKSGIKEGEIVIKNPPRGLADGAKVRVGEMK